MFKNEKKRLGYVDSMFRNGSKNRSRSSSTAKTRVNNNNILNQTMDVSSFGAPRASYYNVVGPTNFNYLPKKAHEAGPG